MMITWKHRSDTLPDPLPLELKIEIFEARLWGWQLHVADLIINGGLSQEGDRKVEAIPHSAFAALQIALVYFEVIAKYEAGYTGRESEKYFELGVLSVLPELNSFPYSSTRSLLKALYTGARCGLYHQAMTAPGVRLQHRDLPVALESGPNYLAIDPHVLIPRLKQHLADYLVRLRDAANGELRRHFEKCFDHALRGQLG